jgi:hypothetical protein
VYKLYIMFYFEGQGPVVSYYQIELEAWFSFVHLPPATGLAAAIWSAAVEGWKAGMGTLYIFGAGLQGLREDGRYLISCCRKKEGRWKEAWIHLENHADVSSLWRIPSGDCGELLSTRKQSQSKRHFSRTLPRSNYTRSTP